MYHAGRSVAVLVCAALAAGAAADAARAGTASGRPAQFAAAGGERNDLTVDAGSGGAVRFGDAGAPVSSALPWCAPFPPGQALCDPDGDPRDTDGGGVSVELGDGDDRALIRWIPGTDTRPGAIRVAAGAGDDRVENLANGVIGFDGGDGNDTLVTGPTAGAILLGGAGADLMASSGGCCAVASYGDHTGAGVRVTLDRTANDGLPGEGDDVRTSGVLGSPRPDVITGDGGPNALTGAGGADALAGGGGDDTIDATLQDGPGDADAVTCGAGNDDVVADERDTVAVDCERIRVGLSAGPELVLDMGAGRAGRAGTVKLTYRVAFPNPDNALASRSTFRLVDTKGRAASSAAQFVLGGDANVARLRVKLNRATRSRLARTRSGALALIGQRVSRSADPESAAAGYEQFNAPVTIRRGGTR
ncbi:MAG: hypothetical protein QOD69_1741 [Solirubrobacteraceae bacterium]|nr:hypothetical protein [Solirubrobacteraceae bacterium]